MNYPTSDEITKVQLLFKPRGSIATRVRQRGARSFSFFEGFIIQCENFGELCFSTLFYGGKFFIFFLDGFFFVLKVVVIVDSRC